MGDFDWSENEEDTLFVSVGAVAVYENPKGDVVIRQQAVGYHDEDQFVVIPLRYLDTVIKKLEHMRLDLGRESQGD